MPKSQSTHGIVKSFLPLSLDDEAILAKATKGDGGMLWSGVKSKEHGVRFEVY